MIQKKVVILTGSEPRHNYFYNYMNSDSRFNIELCIAEDESQSLERRIFSNSKSSPLEKMHVLERKKNEELFFEDFLINNLALPKNFITISKGDINSKEIVKKIIDANPDILACYGSSLIGKELISIFKGKFLNVHLGLSPYYRGSGTNIWPIINNELHMIGATFMYINEGIDTGEIIHQIRAKIKIDDDIHTIGNKLIKRMVRIYSELINFFEFLEPQKQHKSSKGKLYKRIDFNESACSKLYKNISQNIIKDYIDNFDPEKLPYIVKNPILKEKI